MSLVQIQKEKEELKKKTITPETLFPTWSNMFDYMVEIDRKKVSYDEVRENVLTKLKSLDIDISNSKKCVVAESHRFSDTYQNNAICDVCRRFASGGFGYPGDESTLPSFVALEWDIRTGYIKDWRGTDTVKEFVNHWEKEHL